MLVNLNLFLSRVLLLIFLALATGRSALASSAWPAGGSGYAPERTCLLDDEAYLVPFLDVSEAVVEPEPAPAARKARARAKTKAVGPKQVKRLAKQKVRKKATVSPRGARKAAVHNAARAKVRTVVRRNAVISGRKLPAARVRTAHRAKAPFLEPPVTVVAPKLRKPAHAPAEPRKNILYAVEPVRFVVPEGAAWPRPPPPVERHFDEGQFVRPPERGPPAWAPRVVAIVGSSLSSSVLDKRPVLAVPISTGRLFGERQPLVLRVSRDPKLGVQVSLQLRLSENAKSTPPIAAKAA